MLSESVVRIIYHYYIRFNILKPILDSLFVLIQLTSISDRYYYEYRPNTVFPLHKSGSKLSQSPTKKNVNK